MNSSSHAIAASEPPIALHSQETTPAIEALYDKIEAEFNDIKARYRAKLGPKDVAYIKGLRFKSRVAEVCGRGLLWIGHDPLTFVAAYC
jgi:hypothetical protein